MKVTFYKIEEFIRTVHDNNLYAGVTVDGDSCEQYTMEAYASKVEAMAALTCNSDYKTSLTVHTNDDSYGVIEYAVVEYEVDTDFLDSECGINPNNCTPKDIVELSSCNCFNTLDGEELVEFCVFTPMKFIVEIQDVFNNNVLDYVLFDNFRKAENFADAITLNNIPACKYYNCDENQVEGKAMFYKKPSDLLKDVKVWGNIAEYMTAKEKELKEAIPDEYRES